MAFTPIPIGSLAWGTPVNDALADQDARITVLEGASGGGEAGVYVPANWGTSWRTARDGAGQSRIFAAGDSVTQGYYASDLNATNWISLVRTGVQAAHGDGGSGLFSTSRSDPAISADPAVVAAWQANNSVITTTGTWTVGAQNFGPGITFLQSSAAATATFTVRGSVVKIYNIGGAAPRAGFTYSIDGAPAVAVPVTIGVTQIQTTEIGGLSSGTHTVVIAWDGAPTEVLYLVAVAGENPTGVTVDNAGRSGTQTANWSVASALNGAWNGGTLYPADLVIVSLGLNDANNSITGEAWMQNMALYLHTIRAANDGATDLMLVIQHLGNFGGPAFYGNYASRVRGLADAYGAVLIDMWKSGRQNWSYMNGLGYWGDPTDPGPSGTDSVHPSDTGHQMIADAILPVVLS